jgi:Skp family chaperone for outer membrane proteins
MTSLALWLALALTAPAAPKIALVRIDDVYRALDSSKKLEAKVGKARAEMRANPRFAAYEESLAELRRLQARIAEADELDRGERGRILRELSNGHAELRSLENEMNEFRRRQSREINRMKVVRMREILDQIRLAVEVLGREGGYDLVFDVSGNTNTGIPVLLYSKETEDLTSAVLEAFGHAAGDLNGTPSN